MPCSECDSTRLIFEAHVKEAEFLRAEALTCIEHVRRLAIYSTTIAGFAVPVLAGLIDFGDAAEVDSIADFLALLTERHFVIQFVCLGVSLTCLAFLRIYVGSFSQIFTFARYFRDYLVPALNRQAGAPAQEVFHWENWLKGNRAARTFSVGDADLAAEPVLIATYVVVYGALFVFISLYFQSFVVFSLTIGGLILLLLAISFWRFHSVLQGAAHD